MARPPALRSRCSIRLEGAGDSRRRLAQRFRHERCVVFKQFLAPQLATEMAADLQQQSFVQSQHGVGSDRQAPQNSAILNRLLFAMNDAQLFELIQAVTGCGPIGCFAGRLYRLDPEPSAKLDWHNDLGDPTRLAAFSVNLGAEPYEGGLLQIRERGAESLLAEIANTGLGDAALFALGPDLEHRVTPTLGRHSRFAVAGWFKSEPRLSFLGLGGRGPR